MFRVLLCLLFPVMLMAQEVPETPVEPVPQETPKKQEEKKQRPQAPVPAPAPQAPAATKIQGIADDFPMGEENYLPDYKAESVQPEPDPKANQPEPTQPSNGKGFSFGSLFQGDKTLFNVLVLCALIGIFVLYHLRGRRQR
ncbi:MAG: hypothetical protein JNM27_15920 [Leptospirales bacterium]|nr:hypothetical protein [Leptospirales bacterium]